MQQDDISPNNADIYGNYRPPIEALRVGFGRRAGAFVIDRILEGSLAVVVGIVLLAMDMQLSMLESEQIEFFQSLYMFLGMSKSRAAELVDSLSFFMFSGTILAVAYPVIEGLTGRTPGKLALGLVVAHSDGQRGTMRLWMKRMFIKNISSYLGFLALLPALNFLNFLGTFLGLVIFIGCFFALGYDRLALHDRIAGTAIFRTS